MSNPPPHYGGMTVNERLFVAGLLEQFDAAVRRGDLEGAIALLGQVDMNHASAASTVDAILSNPAKYGYA